MSTKVTKAQLQDEVERLRAHVDHLETMNAALNEQVASLRSQLAQAKTVAERPARRVFEFNPNVPGDYHRALLLAKQHNGVARRAAQ